MLHQAKRQQGLDSEIQHTRTTWPNECYPIAKGMLYIAGCTGAHHHRTTAARTPGHHSYMAFGMKSTAQTYEL